MNTNQKYYVWQCPNGALAAATTEQLGNGEAPWAFHGYTYIGTVNASSASEAREAIADEEAGIRASELTSPNSMEFFWMYDKFYTELTT